MNIDVQSVSIFMLKQDKISEIEYYIYVLSLYIKLIFQCKTCDRCQRYEKIKTQAPELKTIEVNKALELVGMDLIGKLLFNTSNRSIFTI